MNCKGCGKRIYWVDDLGLWYHSGLYDMLTCPADVVEPVTELTPGIAR